MPRVGNRQVTGVYYLISQKPITSAVRFHIRTAGQMTRHPRSRLYQTRDGLIGVQLQNSQGDWKEDRPFSSEYALYGEFPTWEEANEARANLLQIVKVHQA